MPPFFKALGRGARFCADCAGTFLCWVLWLVLGIVLAVQLGIAFSHELAVPRSVLRSLEERFAASHVRVHFGRATFDPRGRVLLENLQLSLPEFPEPVAEARAVFVELDPWFLLAGKLDTRRVQAAGVTLFVPAMLAPSGRNEEMCSDLAFSLAPADGEVAVEYLTGRIAGVGLTVDGAVHVSRAPQPGPVAPLPLIENFARRYPDVCRQFIRGVDSVSFFEDPILHVTLAPSRSRGAIADVTLLARAVKLPQWRGLSASEVSLFTRLPLLGDAPTMSPLIATAAEVATSDGIRAQRVQAQIRGVLKLSPFSYSRRDIEVRVGEVAARGFSLDSVALQLAPGVLPLLEGRLVAGSLGSLLAVEGRADLAQQTASVHFDGTLAPALLAPIGAALKRDLRPFIGFGAPASADVDATFAPGWKFERLAGRIAASQIDAHGVPMDSIRGEIAFDGRTFLARHAVAKLGDNFARGSFEQDLATLAFRFLLDGRLRPPAIAGWFRPWWSNFFEHFEFPQAPPNASVDVSGHWRQGHETSVFLFAEARDAVIRGAAFDYARTLLFIRPNFIDGLEVFGSRGGGDLRGTFARHVALPSYQWRDLDIAFKSTLELDNGLKLLGPELARQLSPVAFTHAPELTIAAHFDGPAAPDGEHRTLHIRAQSTGDFSLFRFPARNVSFVADLHDDDLNLDQVEAEVAGGTLKGQARAWGPVAERRLRFDASLRGASLGQAVRTVSQYAALRRGQPSADADKILPGKNTVRLDLALAAEGRFDDLYSYKGGGTAALEGAELGELRLLGLLSDLLNFTALRFTTAHADFTVNGRKVTFPNVNVTGANSAIQAHGDYWLDRHQLDFNARVFPFQESKSLIQSVVGAVLTPLSTVLEVKLTGPLDQPAWAFVIGPTNLFRSLSQPDGTPAAPPAPAEPKPDAQKPENSAEKRKTH